MEDGFIKCPRCGKEVQESAMKAHLNLFCTGPKEAIPEPEAEPERAPYVEEVEEEEAEAEAAEIPPEPVFQWADSSFRDFSSSYKRLSKVHKRVAFMQEGFVCARNYDDAANCAVNLELAEPDVHGTGVMTNVKDFAKDGSVTITVDDDGVVRGRSLKGATRPVLQELGVRDHFRKLTFEEREDTSSFLLPLDKLRLYAKTLVSCVQSDGGRPILGGVLFEFSGNFLTLVASDGFRLAKTPKLPVVPSKGGSEETRIVVPALAVSAAAAVFSGSSGLFSYSNGVVRIASGEGWVLAEEVRGEFPHYEQSLKTFDTNIPETSFSIEGKALKEAVLSLGSLKDYDTVVLELNGVLKLRQWGMDKTSSVEVPVISASGTGELAADPEFLLDGLSPEPVAISWRGHKGVIHIDSHVSYFLMPKYIEWPSDQEDAAEPVTEEKGDTDGEADVDADGEAGDDEHNSGEEG